MKNLRAAFCSAGVKTSFFEDAVHGTPRRRCTGGTVVYDCSGGRMATTVDGPEAGKLALGKGVSIAPSGVSGFGLLFVVLGLFFILNTRVRFRGRVPLPPFASSLLIV